jgi:hypothetical protein
VVMRIGRLRQGLVLLVLVVLSSMFIAALIVDAQTAGNGLTVPAGGAVARGVVDVKGVANSSTFSRWQLDLLLDGNPDAAVFLSVGWVPGPLAYTLDTTAWPDGPQALRLRVVRRDGNYDEYITPFTIANSAPAQPAPAPSPAATAPSQAAAASPLGVSPLATPLGMAASSLGVSPIATPPDVPPPPPDGIYSPQNGATVQGSIAVTGHAAGPAFQKWQLDLLLGGDPAAATLLGIGTTPGDFTLTLNSTFYPDGRHVLRLRDVRRDGNYDEYTRAITIANKSTAAPAAGSGAATSGPRSQ